MACRWERSSYTFIVNSGSTAPRLVFRQVEQHYQSISHNVWTRHVHPLDVQTWRLARTNCNVTIKKIKQRNKSANVMMCNNAINNLHFYIYSRDTRHRTSHTTVPSHCSLSFGNNLTQPRQKVCSRRLTDQDHSQVSLQSPSHESPSHESAWGDCQTCPWHVSHETVCRTGNLTIQLDNNRSSQRGIWIFAGLKDYTLSLKCKVELRTVGPALIWGFAVAPCLLWKPKLSYGVEYFGFDEALRTFNTPFHIKNDRITVTMRRLQTHSRL